MSLPEKREPIITFWLLPSRPEGDYLRRLIRDLATRYDAPVFEPHVTLCSTPAANIHSPEEIIRAATNCRPLTLHINGIEHSEQFTKTLFIDLALSPELLALVDALKAKLPESNDDALKPHVSLIYKDLDQQRRLEVAESIQLPFAEIAFDTVCAIRIPSPVKSKADVEAWTEAAPPQMLKL
jgi:2'-5' RNA ligase